MNITVSIDCSDRLSGKDYIETINKNGTKLVGITGYCLATYFVSICYNPPEGITEASKCNTLAIKSFFPMPKMPHFNQRCRYSNSTNIIITTTSTQQHSEQQPE
ncbi:hypothetical protein ACTFIU_006616 [Dictyostelium citrinum]